MAFSAGGQLLAFSAVQHSHALARLHRASASTYCLPCWADGIVEDGAAGDQGVVAFDG